MRCKIKHVAACSLSCDIAHVGYVRSLNPIFGCSNGLECHLYKLVKIEKDIFLFTCMCFEFRRVPNP